MERRSPTPERTGQARRLASLSYDEALTILDKGQVAAPSSKARTRPRGALAVLALAGAVGAIGLLGQASLSVLDCPATPSPWRPDCAEARSSAVVVQAAAIPVADAREKPAGTVETAPRKRSVVARGAAKGADAAPAVAAAPASASLRDEDDETPTFSLSTAAAPAEPAPLAGASRQSLARELSSGAPAPRAAARPTPRPDEPKRVVVAARIEPPVEASRPPPLPPVRPQPEVDRPSAAGPAAASAARAPASAVRARVGEEVAERAVRSIRRGVAAPVEVERPAPFPRAFVRALRENDRRVVSSRPEIERSDRFPPEFMRALREHNMAYSSQAGRRSGGW